MRPRMVWSMGQHTVWSMGRPAWDTHRRAIHLRWGMPPVQSLAMDCRIGHFLAKPASPACRHAAKPASYPMK